MSMADYYSFVRQEIDSTQIDESIKTALRRYYGVLFDKKNFHPDISGYYLGILQPAVFSGIGATEEMYDDLMKKSVLLIQDISPPEMQVDTEQLAHASGIVPYASEVEMGNQFTVVYIDNLELQLYSYHVVWVHYIEAVLGGLVRPSDEYLMSGQIDYMGALHIAKFTPDGRMNFAAQCVGIFPLGLPSKDVIGNRTNPQITTVTQTYACVAYSEATEEAADIFPHASHIWYETFHRLEKLA